MQQNKITVLSTRPLDNELVIQAGRVGIDIDELSFIETESILSVEVQQEIQQALILSTTIVFTSINAVESVAIFMEEQKPDWTIYCIGSTTAKLVKKYFGEASIAGTASDAASLGTLIAADRFADEVIFFCGDQRRDELPDILRSNDILVNEIVVYQTIAVPRKINKDYHGILFFSPSAVESFFRNNKLPQSTLLFAIGNTTANEIRKYSTNKIIIAEEPGKENLVKLMIEVFT